MSRQSITAFLKKMKLAQAYISLFCSAYSDGRIPVRGTNGGAKGFVQELVRELSALASRPRQRPPRDVVARQGSVPHSAASAGPYRDHRRKDRVAPDFGAQAPQIQSGGSAIERRSAVLPIYFSTVVSGN
jgi:hypothetical protein